MIPKIIHYVWVGGGPLTPLAEKCIESWKKFCPDYEIKRWDETNFDINQNIYCKEAYESKKWAFVSDYIRAKVLYDFGGIYLDTDVELIRPIDEFLSHSAFAGFETVDAISTGILGVTKNNIWIKSLLDSYNNRHFINEYGQFDFTTNVTVLTNLTKQQYPNMVFDNTKQILENLVVYPIEYFCPFSFVDKQLRKTENSYAIHWFDGSWVPKKNIFQKIWSGIKGFCIKIIGKNNAQKLKAKFKRKR